jgi:hypothetical protein
MQLIMLESIFVLTLSSSNVTGSKVPLYLTGVGVPNL